VVEVLKQPQYDPQPVEREVVQIYAVTNGAMDDFPVEDAKRFAREFCEYLDTRHPEVSSTIRETGDLSDETEETLKAALDAFVQSFAPTEHGPGSEVALGETTPPDEIKPDVGWDRMSSVHEDMAEEVEKTPEQRRAEFEEKAGPLGSSDAPSPM
jgi:F-type H+-transporting ATPase subunit alpha